MTVRGEERYANCYIDTIHGERIWSSNLKGFLESDFKKLGNKLGKPVEVRVATAYGVEHVWVRANEVRAIGRR